MRTEHATQRTDQAHHVGRGDAGVEIDPAVFDLLGQVFLADFVGSGFLGGDREIALGEHHHPLAAADAMRQHHGAADDLVGLLGIDAQADMDFDGLIELRVSELLQNLHRFGERLSLFGGNLRYESAKALGLFWHIHCLRHRFS